jgi:polar amino acid transport system permease protein
VPTTEIVAVEPPGATVAPIKAVPARRPGRWISGTVLLLAVVGLGYALATNPRMEWSVIGEHLTAGPILRGLMTTLQLTVVAMEIGLVMGVLLAVMRLSDNPVARGFAWAYVGLFRGTPLLVQVILWYNLSAIFPSITLGLPAGPDLLVVDVNVLITPYVAAILGLGLNEGAYMAEIVRSGIASISPGQRQAAAALGLSRRQTMTRIVLPQAMRVIVPPTGNETITMLKMTSIVSVIAMHELLYSAQAIYSQTYQTIPLLIVVSIWYLVVTSLLTLIQSALERRFSRGHAPTRRTSLRQRLTLRPKGSR